MDNGHLSYSCVNKQDAIRKLGVRVSHEMDVWVLDTFEHKLFRWFSVAIRACRKYFIQHQEKGNNITLPWDYLSSSKIISIITSCQVRHKLESRVCLVLIFYRTTVILYKSSIMIIRGRGHHNTSKPFCQCDDKLFKCPHPRISINVFWFITSRAGHLLLLNWKRTSRKQSN